MKFFDVSKISIQDLAEMHKVSSKDACASPQFQQSQSQKESNEEEFNATKEYLKRTAKLVDESITRYSAKTTSGTVESYESQSAETLINASSRDIRRILNDNEMFEQNLKSLSSIIYPILLADLLELNLKKRNLNNSYSQDINEYFKMKLNRELFDHTNTEHTSVMQIINDKNFLQYYKYGCQAQDVQGSFNLEIDSEFLENCTNILYADQYTHNFDLKRTDICLSVNNYGITEINYETQRQSPLIRKTQHMLSSTSDPNFISQESFDVLKKLRTR